MTYYSYDRTAGVVLPLQTREQAYEKLHGLLEPAREAAVSMAEDMQEVTARLRAVYSTMQQMRSRLALLRHKAAKEKLQAEVAILDDLKKGMEAVDDPMLERFSAPEAEKFAGLLRGLAEDMKYK